MELKEADLVTAVEPIDVVASMELSNWLRSAVAQLPDQQATIFVMTHFEHLSRDEIANLLKVTPAAVSTALHKARQQLSRDLTVYYQGELP